MLSVKLIAASINGTVSDLNKALSSGSTLNHKNLIKVSHLYRALARNVGCQMQTFAGIVPGDQTEMVNIPVTPHFLCCRRSP